jgi:hypothetical protein
MRQMKSESRTTRALFVTRFFTATTIVTACAVLFACGGGGGGTSAGSAINATPATQAVGSIAVGTFVDGPVAGLAYECGTQRGFTDAKGTFSYIVGSPITFKVGDIVLGTTNGAGVITPMSLAGNGSSADTPMVVAIVQFLKTIANDDGSGNLSIPESVMTASAGKSIDFAAVDASTQIAAVAAQVASGKTLVTAKEAESHMIDSIFKLAAGTYRGTWVAPASVPSSGLFTVTISTNGSMYGIAMLGKTKIDVTSTMTSKLVEDSTFAINGKVSNGATWSGKINLDKKKLYGNALYDGVNATFSAEAVAEEDD